MKVAAVALAAVLAGCASGASSPATTTAAAPSTMCPAPGEGKFEMRSYFLVLLRRGPAWTAEKTPETQRLFEGHMANIQAMGASGELVLAGPTDVPATDTTAIAGIFLFDVATREEVEALLAKDPAIVAGRLAPEILPWYGPVGLTYPGQRAIVAPE